MVLSTTLLRSAGGQVVAAATNTGCPPHASDVMVFGERLATADERIEALQTFVGGDWSAIGTWHTR